jgi:hypothetical protein
MGRTTAGSPRCALSRGSRGSCRRAPPWVAAAEHSLMWRLAGRGGGTPLGGLRCAPPRGTAAEHLRGWRPRAPPGVAPRRARWPPRARPQVEPRRGMWRNAAERSTPTTRMGVVSPGDSDAGRGSCTPRCPSASTGKEEMPTGQPLWFLSMGGPLWSSTKYSTLQRGDSRCISTNCQVNLVAIARLVCSNCQISY